MYGERPFRDLGERTARFHHRQHAHQASAIQVALVITRRKLPAGRDSLSAFGGGADPRGALFGALPGCGAHIRKRLRNNVQARLRAPRHRAPVAGARGSSSRAERGQASGSAHPLIARPVRPGKAYRRGPKWYVIDSQGTGKPSSITSPIRITPTSAESLSPRKRRPTANGCSLSLKSS